MALIAVVLVNLVSAAAIAVAALLDAPLLWTIAALLVTTAVLGVVVARLFRPSVNWVSYQRLSKLLQEDSSSKDVPHLRAVDSDGYVQLSKLGDTELFLYRAIGQAEWHRIFAVVLIAQLFLCFVSVPLLFVAEILGWQVYDAWIGDGLLKLSLVMSALFFCGAVAFLERKNTIDKR